MKQEIRNLKTPVTVEKREDGTIKSIVGYPIVYNKDSEDMGFIERIAPGAATKALKNSDVRGLKNHDASLIFARTGVNLTLTEDKDGVRMEATPIDTLNFREISKEIDAGLLDGQSFAFTIKADEWKGLDTDKPERTITEFDMMFDVGPVTYPAYPDTTVGLRTLEVAREASKDIQTDKDGESTNVKRANDIVEDILLSGDESISVIVLDKDNDEVNVFTGATRFDEATEKIKSLRSDTSPTTTDSDNLNPDPTIIEDEDGKDDTLDRINEQIKRYSK